MSSGLLLSGIVAYAIAHTGAIDAFFPLMQTATGRLVRAPTALAYIAMLAPLGFVLVLSFGVNRLSTTTVQALFWAFCAAMGAGSTSIFVIYTGASIVEVFFITAATYAATIIYGYTTKTDMTRKCSFHKKGLFGIIIASLVTKFVQSSALQYVISYIGVIVFVANRTAYDGGSGSRPTTCSTLTPKALTPAARRGVYDALSLYLNFINLFMFLLQIMGVRNNNLNLPARRA